MPKRKPESERKIALNVSTVEALQKTAQYMAEYGSGGEYWWRKLLDALNEDLWKDHQEQKKKVRKSSLASGLALGDAIASVSLDHGELETCYDEKEEQDA